MPYRIAPLMGTMLSGKVLNLGVGVDAEIPDVKARCQAIIDAKGVVPPVVLKALRKELAKDAALVEAALTGSRELRLSDVTLMGTATSNGMMRLFRFDH